MYYDKLQRSRTWTGLSVTYIMVRIGIIHQIYFTKSMGILRRLSMLVMPNINCLYVRECKSKSAELTINIMPADAGRCQPKIRVSTA